MSLGMWRIQDFMTYGIVEPVGVLRGVSEWPQVPGGIPVTVLMMDCAGVRPEGCVDLNPSWTTLSISYEIIFSRLGTKKIEKVRITEIGRKNGKIKLSKEISFQRELLSRPHPATASTSHLNCSNQNSSPNPIGTTTFSPFDELRDQRSHQHPAWQDGYTPVKKLSDSL